MNTEISVIEVVIGNTEIVIFRLFSILTVTNKEI